MLSPTSILRAAMKKTSALFPRIALLAMSGALVFWRAGATEAPIITGIAAEPGRVTPGVPASPPHGETPPAHPLRARPGARRRT